MQGDQFLGENPRLLGTCRREPIIDTDVATLLPADVLDSCRNAERRACVSGLSSA